MKKIFLTMMVVAAIALTGCKEKEQIAGVVYYETDAVDSVFVIRGHGTYAQQFLTTMNEVLLKYKGTVNPDEKQMKADFCSVANQFNNRYLFGNLRLIRTFDGETTILEKFSLQTQPKFYIYDYSKVQGDEAELLEFQQAVIVKVADLDEAEGVGSLTEDAVKEAMQTIYDKYNQNALLSGDFVVSYYDGKEDKSVVTYTFVPKNEL